MHIYLFGTEFVETIDTAAVQQTVVTFYLAILFKAIKQLPKMLRNNHQRCSVRKAVLRNFWKFTGKHLCQSLLFNKIEGLTSATLSRKRLWHGCFPVNFPKFLRIPFLKNISGRLLLNAVKLDSVKLQKQQYTPIPNKAKQNSKISYYLLHQ